MATKTAKKAPLTRDQEIANIKLIQKDYNRTANPIDQLNVDGRVGPVSTNAFIKAMNELINMRSAVSVHRKNWENQKAASIALQSIVEEIEEDNDMLRADLRVARMQARPRSLSGELVKFGFHIAIGAVIAVLTLRLLS